VKFITDFFFHFIVALALNGIGSFLAWKRENLRVDGALVAFIVGMTLFLITPIAWIILLVFFASSSLLSKLKKETSQTKSKAQEMFEKGGRRDAGQVVANSLAGILFLLLFLPQGSEFDLVSASVVAYVGTIAAANADTWATEIGTIASSARWVLNPRRTVPPGTSGGVSLLGTLASLMGSLTMALLFLVCLTIHTELGDDSLPSIGVTLAILCIITTSGFVGSFVDSVLGATIQAFYFCPSCNIGTEKRVHKKCGGTVTILKRGHAFVGNDLVNLLAAALAGLLAFVSFSLVS